MIADRLAIPLQENPARQKFWRAVGFLALIMVAVILGYFIDRVIHFRTLSNPWPANATIEMRFVKTPKVTRYVQEGFSGAQVLPGTPWDLPEALSWSKRELIVYSSSQTVVGLLVDGTIPQATLNSLHTWGWDTVPVGNRTLIVESKAAEPGALEKHSNYWLTLPIFDGSVTLKDEAGSTQGVPFRFSSATSLDFPVNTQAFIPQTTLSLPSETQLTGSFALPADLAEAFLPSNVSATFPGLRHLSDAGLKQGIEILLGQDGAGQAFVLSIPGTTLSLEELGEIATEGAGIQSLSTTVLTNDDLQASTEIRSAGEIEVEVNNNDGIASAVAKTSQGKVFRLTQTTTQLIVSNRDPIIGLEVANYSGHCLKHPQGFISPQTLAISLPGLSQTTGTGLISHLGEAEEIAYRKNWLRICW